MATKQNEYKADILKISVFAFCAPLAKEFLVIPYLASADFTANYVLYLIQIALLAISGILLFMQGIKLLKE